MKLKSKKIPIIGIIIGIVLVAILGALAVTSDLMTSTEKQNESFEPRIIFWRHIHGLGFDPSDRTILYIATHGDFYQSFDGGPPIKVDEKRADYMAFVAPQNPGFPLYSSGHPETGGNTGLIKSTDGGKTWEHVSDVIDPPVDFHAMAISSSDPKIIVGFDSAARGLFKTTDAGKSWESLPFPGYISSLAISPFDSKLIMAGTAQGIFKSEDGGMNWSELENYQKMKIHALAFDENGTLFASVDTFGLVKSADLGKSWENLDTIDLTVSSIAADFENKIIYVAGYSSGGFQEVYKLSYNLETYELIATNKES